MADQGERTDAARRSELERIIERSLGQGVGALFADSSFLAGSVSRLGLDRPIFEAVASDSGIEEMEELDESNLAAIE